MPHHERTGASEWNNTSVNVVSSRRRSQVTGPARSALAVATTRCRGQVVFCIQRTPTSVNTLSDEMFAQHFEDNVDRIRYTTANVPAPWITGRSMASATDTIQNSNVGGYRDDVEEVKSPAKQCPLTRCQSGWSSNFSSQVAQCVV